MIIRMIHPEHGATHVYDVADLERHRKLGWVPEDELKATKAQEIVALPVVEAPIDPVAEEPAKRRPGRPRKVQ